MQAAQIDPTKLYAIELRSANADNEKVVVRFRVQHVRSVLVRRKLKATSADYNHSVLGEIEETDVPTEMLPSDEKERKAFLERSIDPSQVLGEYTEFIELAAKAKAEEAGSKARQELREANAQALEELLYRFTGLPRAVRTRTAWGTSDFPFSATYSGNVAISESGVEALLKAVQGALDLLAVAR